jgi:hypothetical protein
MCLLSSCSLSSRRMHREANERKAQEPYGGHTTPAQEYVGEILSYLVQVVLGKAGRVSQRADWTTTGIHEQLDLDNIYKIMTDPELNRGDVMVLDANILDLSQVLYTYDENLSLSKGQFGLLNIYPAPEFLAVRLLLVQKLNRKEKIHLEPLLERKEMLFNEEIPVTEEDLVATQLTAEEMRLIRDVLKKEPVIYLYLQNPFLVEALYDLGLLEMDGFVQRSIEMANYKAYPCRSSDTSSDSDAVNIAILPSLTMEFYAGESSADYPPYGFRPTDFLVKMIHKLRNEILSCAEGMMKKDMAKTESGAADVIARRWHALWDKVVQKRISFCIEDQRPLVIYPENARRVVRDVCPQADFAVILLGKNVYLALSMDSGTDTLPAVKWNYVDISDVKHSQFQEECEQVARFICAKLKTDLSNIAHVSQNVKKIGSPP